jgi:hypothetical protein
MAVGLSKPVAIWESANPCGTVAALESGNPNRKTMPSSEPAIT